MQILIGGRMAFIYALMILFVLYCIVSDWFIHEYGERLNGDNFYKFKIDSFFSYQTTTLRHLFGLNEENLAKQPIFWIGIILPLIVASWIEYHVIILDPDLLSFEKLEDFFKASSSALYISALIPTFGVIISNIHRTIQTKKQIETSLNQIKISNEQFNLAQNQFEATKIKNTLDSYYTHFNNTISEFRKITFRKNSKSKTLILKNKEIVIYRPVRLYRNIFNKSNPVNGYDISLNEKFIIKIGEVINRNLPKIEINEEVIKKIIKNGDTKTFKLYLQAYRQFNKEIFGLFYARCITGRLIEQIKNEEKSIDIKATFNEMFFGVSFTQELIINVLDILDVKRNNSLLNGSLMSLSQILRRLDDFTSKKII